MTAMRAVLVGLGHRTACYAHYAKENCDEMVVVGLADPDARRLTHFAEKWGVPPERCFTTAQELAEVDRFADFAVNGTMDELHIETTIPLVEAGYHVLLEKPIAPDEKQLMRLRGAVKKSGVKVVICHVLRYAPFYRRIKERIVAGEIGEIMHIRTSERVSYHHNAVAFVRGKWRKRSVNPMLLAKCCHDLDLICWYLSGVRPTKVSSMGGRHFFTPDNAPPLAGENCFNCEIERDCIHSAIRHYLDNRWWQFYALAGQAEYETGQEVDREAAESHLSKGQYNTCVWKSDGDVVDRQSVVIEFENGVVATHDLVTNTARATRTVDITGSEGEISGDMESGRFTIRHANPLSGGEFIEEVVDCGVSGDLHGGGDARLVADFLAVMKGEEPSISTTTLQDSLNSHLIAYAADRSMLESITVDLMDERR